MGQLVDQHKLGFPFEQTIEVHLLEGLAPVLAGPAREHGQIPDLRIGLGPFVVLHPADDHVGAALLASPSLVEHGEGLAHTGGGTEIEP